MANLEQVLVLYKRGRGKLFFEGKRKLGELKHHSGALHKETIWPVILCLLFSAWTETNWQWCSESLILKKSSPQHTFELHPSRKSQSMSIILRLLQPNIFPYYKRQRKGTNFLMKKSKNPLNANITAGRLNLFEYITFFSTRVTSWRLVWGNLIMEMIYVIFGTYLFRKLINISLRY